MFCHATWVLRAEGGNMGLRTPVLFSDFFTILLLPQINSFA